MSVVIPFLSGVQNPTSLTRKCSDHAWDEAPGKNNRQWICIGFWWFLSRSVHFYINVAWGSISCPIFMELLEPILAGFSTGFSTARLRFLDDNRPSVFTLWWTNIAMENHHFKWENSLFLWPFSIAMLVHQRVCCPFVLFLGGNSMCNRQFSYGIHGNIMQPRLRGSFGDCGNRISSQSVGIEPAVRGIHHDLPSGKLT